MLGVSEVHYKKLLSGNELKNSPVVGTDVVVARHIFGPSTKMLQGKTPATSDMHVIGYKSKVPLLIARKYRDVILTGDIMKINKINFLIIKSRYLKFTTAAFIVNQKEDTMMKVMLQVHELYRGRGFKIMSILMDGQFQCLDGPLSALDVSLNICSNAEHVGEIERNIRTVKERVRCIYVTLPFEKMPGRLIVKMVYTVIFWLNCFYPSETVVKGSSPRTIMTGRNIDYK